MYFSGYSIYYINLLVLIVDDTNNSLSEEVGQAYMPGFGGLLNRRKTGSARMARILLNETFIWTGGSVGGFGDLGRCLRGAGWKCQMDHIFDSLRDWVFGLLPFSGHDLKSMFVNAGLRPVWHVLRDYIFGYKGWIFGLLPCLFLERLLPASRGSRRALFYDWIYPIANGILIFPFVNILITEVSNFYHQTLPFLNTGLLDNNPLWLQGIGAFLIADLMFYVSHRLRHKVKWLWYFHSIHHSQEHLNPMTGDRSHFVDQIAREAIATVPIAFVGGASITWSIFVVVRTFWASFIHANVKTNLGPFKYILVSPQFHRLHHSIMPEHFDVNYGERLAIWDFLFGTMAKDFDCYPPVGVKGIERWVVESDNTERVLIIYWFKQTFYPFYKVGQSIGQQVAKVIGSANEEGKADLNST
jgi:sterol desaturase/sphingolipid hydroxylase (fatty acid hydroxylase superfamily)